MNHWIIAPVLLPAVVAALIVLAMRSDLLLQRVFSLAATVALVLMALALTFEASSGRIQVYELGDWPAPFGIVLVLDRLAAMMVLLTALLALCVQLYVIGSGWDERGRHFHALFQFQLMGICGAFLTGDAFNLFVFFEILLIASYGLMIHGGGETRLRAGVQYVIYNLAGSTLFLFALGTIYSVTGTLNMADLALRVAEIPAEDTALLRVGVVLLLLVFAIKAALVPLQFWLPGTYANAPGPVAALFAVMTKVGAYAILRMYTLAFPPEGPAGDIGGWVLPAALVTLILGMVGVLGAGSIARLVAFAAIGSMGTLLIAVGLFTPEATAAALYYTVHSTLATAALFLAADLVASRRGAVGGALVPAPPIAQNGLVAAMFFLGAIAMAGLPPLSGFFGKLLVMDAVRAASADWPLIWGVILVTSLIAVVGFARAGSVVFWKAWASPPPESTSAEPAPASLPSVALGALLAGIVLLTALAGPAMDYFAAAARQLHAPAAYIAAVLGSR